MPSGSFVRASLSALGPEVFAQQPAGHDLVQNQEILDSSSSAAWVSLGINDNRMNVSVT